MLKDFGWLIGLILLLIFLRIFLGGSGGSLVSLVPQSDRAERISTPRANSSPNGSSSDTEDDGPLPGESVYSGKIELNQGNAKAASRKNEYVRITANRKNTDDIAISGWKLKSAVSKRTVIIGDGVEVLTSTNFKHKTGPIVLAPGETATISTPGAPTGVSFKLNKCSGYLGQFQTYSPRISTKCPYIEDEDLASFGIKIQNFKDEDEFDECLDYIEGIGRCETSRGKASLPDACRDFIRDYANYAGCVTLHKNDDDFLDDEWRIYLGITGGDGIWRSEREEIQLIDRSGKIVDSVSY